MKKIRPFLCAALSALLLTALTAPVSAAEEDTMLQFDENGEFRILIVADTQDTARPQEATLRLLNAELDAADADLVVFTGDQIHGPSVRTTKAMEKALDAILAPVAERGIPFAAVFGNHDDEGGVSKETQLAIYQSYPGCLMSAGPDDITGCGNYNLLVWSSDGSRPVVKGAVRVRVQHCPDRDGILGYLNTADDSQQRGIPGGIVPGNLVNDLPQPGFRDG